jgi:hypothetical protein
LSAFSKRAEHPRAAAPVIHRKARLFGTELSFSYVEGCRQSATSGRPPVAAFLAVKDLMDEKISYVERVLGFRFKEGFAQQFAEVGSSPEDLDIWYKNAQVYESAARLRAPRESERIPLTVLIEAIRFEAAFPPLPGEPHDFDLASYEFSENVLEYKPRVIEAVLRQEAASPSFFNT